MHKYYRVCYVEQPGCGSGHLESEFISLPDSGYVEDWKPMIFDIRDGGFPDYLPTNKCLHVCSEKMRAFIDQHVSTVDRIQWLDASARTSVEERPYFIIHFPEPPDVLNLDETRFVENTDQIIQAVLSSKKAAFHSVFTFPGSGGLAMIFSEEVREAALSAGLTGFQFREMVVRTP